MRRCGDGRGEDRGLSCQSKGLLHGFEVATVQAHPWPIDALRQWGVNWVGFLGPQLEPDHCFLEYYEFLAPRKSSRLNSPMT
jgi:hypothetical protein